MIKLKDILNEATPKEKGNLQVMKPKFKKTLDTQLKIQYNYPHDCRTKDT